MLYSVSLLGFSQMRIEYWRAESCTSPTPGTRERTCSRWTGRIAQVIAIMLPSSEIAPRQSGIFRGLVHLHSLTLHHRRQARHGELKLVLHLGPSSPDQFRGKVQLQAGRTSRITARDKLKHRVETGHFCSMTCARPCFQPFPPTPPDKRR